MPVRHLDHVTLVVEDLDAAIEFFVHLGLEVLERASIDGEWAGRVVGIDGARSEITMVQTPDGHGRLELQRYDDPPATGGDPAAPSNTFGIRTVAFEVDDIDTLVAELADRGFGLVGELVTYADVYKLCYVRGPEGIVVMLAERLDRV